METQINGCRLQLVQGDITDQAVDAIVNAANSGLRGGGGVDGAIHRAGGPTIMQETRQRYPQGCPTGQAVITGAGQLPCQYVIHAVGPVWHGGQAGEAGQLASAYRHSLEQAIAHDCQSVAFPALSAGAYGYPLDKASREALQTVWQFLMTEGKPALIRFVLFDGGAYGAFSQALEQIVAENS